MPYHNTSKETNVPPEELFTESFPRLSKVLKKNSIIR